MFFGVNYPENMPEADALAIAKSILEEAGTKVGGFFKVDEYLYNVEVEQSFYDDLEMDGSFSETKKGVTVDAETQ